MNWFVSGKIVVWWGMVWRDFIIWKTTILHAGIVFYQTRPLSRTVSICLPIGAPNSCVLLITGNDSSLWMFGSKFILQLWWKNKSLTTLINTQRIRDPFMDVLVRANLIFSQFLFSETEYCPCADTCSSISTDTWRMYRIKLLKMFLYRILKIEVYFAIFYLAFFSISILNIEYSF